MNRAGGGARPKMPKPRRSSVLNIDPTARFLLAIPLLLVPATADRPVEAEGRDPCRLRHGRGDL